MPTINKGLIGKEDILLGANTQVQQRQLGTSIQPVDITGLDVPFRFYSIEQLKMFSQTNLITLACIVDNEDLLFYRYSTNPTQLDSKIEFASDYGGSWKLANTTNSLISQKITVYKKSSSIPAKPSGGLLQASKQALITTAPTGWDTVIPSGTDQLYSSSTIVTAKIELVGTSDTVLANWTSPMEVNDPGTSSGMANNGASAKIVFIRATAKPDKPADSSDTPVGWSDDIPSGSNKLYISIGSKTVGATAFVWSDAISIEGTAGLPGTSVSGRPGQAGAGLYTTVARQGIFPADVLANIDFLAHTGRAPINNDTFTYVNSATSPTTSNTKMYNGSSWVTSTFILPRNSIVSDFEIKAPIIKSGRIELVGTNIISVRSAVAFGPDNLLEWTGSRINPAVASRSNVGTNGDPILSQLTKGNAIKFLDSMGFAFTVGEVLERDYVKTRSIEGYSLAIKIASPQIVKYNVSVTFTHLMTSRAVPNPFGAAIEPSAVLKFSGLPSPAGSRVFYTADDITLGDGVNNVYRLNTTLTATNISLDGGEEFVTASFASTLSFHIADIEKPRVAIVTSRYMPATPDPSDTTSTYNPSSGGGSGIGRGTGSSRNPTP